MPKRVSRRKFLKTAAAGVTLLPAAAARTYAANEAINIGIIGTGGQGRVNRMWFSSLGGNNIVALCDVDRGRLEKARKDHPGAKTYVDYRRMLQEHKEIDAVMVSTPDHHHFPASMLAMSLRKAVCTEKPLTHSVWEARQPVLSAGDKGEKTAERLFTMARQAEKMGQRSAAATFYSRVVSDYPGSSAAARAKEGLASLRR